LFRETYERYKTLRELIAGVLNVTGCGPYSQSPL